MDIATTRLERLEVTRNDHLVPHGLLASLSISAYALIKPAKRITSSGYSRWTSRPWRLW